MTKRKELYPEEVAVIASAIGVIGDRPLREKTAKEVWLALHDRQVDLYPKDEIYDKKAWKRHCRL